jgi:hypothetical protein
MALLNNKCRILPSVCIDLTFEDDIMKQFIVRENDIVSVLYNKAGLATRHIGKVTQIGSGDYTSVSSVPRFYGASGIAHYDTVVGKQSGVGEYMIVDGSGDFAGNVVIIYLDTILDISMVSQYDQSLVVQSAKPCGCTGVNQITNLRVYKGYFQFSTNYGETWHTIKPGCGDGPVEPETQVDPHVVNDDDLISSLYDTDGCHCDDDSSNEGSGN